MKKVFLLFVLWCLCALSATAQSRIPGPGGSKPSSGTTFTVVQHKVADSATSAGSISVTVTATGSGNLIVACAGNLSYNEGVQSFADNATGGSNTYLEYVASLGTNNGSANVRSECWYVLGATHAGATSVTASWLQANNYRSIEVWEVSRTSGTWATDAANSIINGTGSGTTVTGASVTTSGSPSFVVGYILVGDSITVNPKAGNEFTAGGDISSFGAGAVSLITSTAASHTPVWTDNSSGDSFASSTAAFK